MPIYEYECTSCRNVFELFQRITESPLSNCPDCSGPVKKLMSMSSFQLKGGGWYADGYNNKSCNSAGSAADNTSSKDSTEKAAKTAGSSAESSATPQKTTDTCCTAT